MPIVTLAIAPSGQVVFLPDGGDGPALPDEVAARIAETFHEGAAAGLLHLAATELATPLPPAFAFWHDFSRRCLTRLCQIAGAEAEEEMIAMLSTWRHSGFHVFCGNRISPDNETAMENLARYIIRVSFSQERMQYLDQEGKVVYTSKDGRTNKSFPALEWLANLCSHIPNRGEQMVRYYGHYSNVSRGKRQKEGSDDVIPCILEPQGDEKIFRRNWARLIQKIYEVDPLVCPKCKGAMRVILKHLGIWLVRSRPPPKIHDPPVCMHSTGGPAAPYIMDDVCCQLPVSDDHLYQDPEYAWDEYIQA